MCCFETYTDPHDPAQRILTIIQADPVIEIADMILERADPTFVEVGDGIVTFHCSNGEVSYGLREHDDLRETWLGVRSGWDPDSDDQG